MFLYGSFGVGNGNPPQYSCLENPMDRGAWKATVYEVAKSQTQLSTRAHTHTHTHTLSVSLFLSLSLFGCCFITWTILDELLCSGLDVIPGKSHLWAHSQWRRELCQEPQIWPLFWKLGIDICWEETAWSEGLSASSCSVCQTKEHW